MVFVFQTFGIDDTLAIIVFALVFSLLLVFIQKRFGGRDRIKEIQKQVNAHQKEVLAATKANDKERLDSLMKKQDEVMGLTTEMLWLSLKGMIIVLPLILILFAYVLPALFPNYLQSPCPFVRSCNSSYIIHLPFPVPYTPQFSGEFPWIHLPFRDYLGVRGLFIYSMFVFGLILEAVIPKAEAKLGRKLF